MKKTFLTGLILILPAILTLFLFITAVEWLTQPFLGVITSILNYFNGQDHHPLILQLFSQALILGFLFLATTLLGYLGNYFFFTKWIKSAEKWIFRIPLVSDIYKSVKDLTGIFKNKGAFQKTALVPFPDQDSKSIGFTGPENVRVIGHAQMELTPQCIAGCPNPLMGFLILVPKDQTIPLSFKPKEASRFIFSCGILSPGSSKKPH